MQVLKFHLGLMLVFSIFLSTVVPSNVHAVTIKEYEMTKVDATSSIEEVFQKFQYSMVVEWDQKDEAFKKQAEQDLVKALLALVEAGISMEEIQLHMQRSLLSTSVQKEYQRLVSAMRDQDLSDEEITSKTMAFMAKTQSQGVNFYGEGGHHHPKWGIIAVVIIVVVVTHLCLKKGKQHRGHDYDHDHDYDHSHGLL